MTTQVATEIEADEVYSDTDLQVADNFVKAFYVTYGLIIAIAIVGHFFVVFRPALDLQVSGKDGAEMPLLVSIFAYFLLIFMVHMMIVFWQDHFARKAILV